MKRFQGALPLIVLAFAVSKTAIAGENMTPGPHGWAGGGLFHMEKCLSALGLPAEQDATVQSVLNTGKATLKADGEVLRTLHQKMQSDIADGADKSVLGQDVLDQDAARTKMKNDRLAIHDQVLAQLSTDQQQTFNGCMAAPKAWRSHSGPAASQ